MCTGGGAACAVVAGAAFATGLGADVFAAGLTDVPGGEAVVVAVVAGAGAGAETAGVALTEASAGAESIVCTATGLPAHPARKKIVQAR